MAMALPHDASQGRVNLIREMARSRSSNASESASESGSVPGFGMKHQQTRLPPPPPQTDFLAETESQKLPALPAMTPQNLHASHLHSEPEFQINTSALRRAFPDFSQYGSSDDGDSFEIGRAAANRRANAPRRILSSEDPSENISLNIGGEKFTVTGTPPTKPKTMARSVSQKENADPLAKQKETAFVSSASSRTSQANRQALSELDPQEESANVTGERPKQAPARASTTRFANPRTRAQQQDHTANSQQHDTVNSAYQSFALPDMSNITELVSGQRQDGTALFQRSAKKPRSRFNSSLVNRREQHDLPVVDRVPAPEDAKSLHVALQLLTEKVQLLEKEKKEATDKADNYEFEFLQLKAQLDARQHSDSGVDVDNEEDTKTRDFEAERMRLEASIKSLKAKLDRANKRLSESEVKISQLRGDKLTAEQQLRDAEANSVALRGEGQDVHDEIEDVKRQLLRVTKQHQKLIDRFTVQEAELKKKIDRRERAVKEMASVARELWATRAAMGTPPAAGRRERSTSQPRAQHRRSSSQRFPASRSTINLPAQIYQQPYVSEPAEATGVTTIDVDDPEYTTELNLEAQGRANIELSKNESFMSFMEGDEIAKLRHILDQEKARAGGIAGRVKEDTLTGLVAGQTSALPHKSSLKKQPSATFHDDLIADVEPSASGIIDETRTSVASQRSSHRRRTSGRTAEDLTSAFILPDITLGGAALNAQAPHQRSRLIRRPIPVSDRAVVATDDNPDSTLRPAQSPGLALATVVQGLEEEVDRLRVQLTQQEQLYNQHDPALSKRERKVVHARIQKLLAAIELRCDQIYALYDVLEGQKDAGQCMDESEVEVTLQNLGIEVTRSASHHGKPRERRRSNSNVSLQQDKRGRKSVVINIDNDNILSDDELPVGESEDEFEGFDTTNTNTQRSVRV